ncbi:ABC transporter ATP-binding protein [Mycolicibacterium sp.]|uniref:ABC transporter ATP-binding protein n=1 Tax=Mycolicibacterium sp. TaxID=2320850 RepID=UPI003D152979
MLELDNVSIAYNGVKAVKGVSISVVEGSLVTLIGSNGAGKTSLLRAISGLVKVSGGEITFKGTRITNERPNKIVAQRLVHCPEGRHVFPRLSVEENLRAGSHVSRKTSAQVMGEVYALFPRLEERRRQLGQSLSGGEQQMLAIGRALMAQPRMLLLDEPSLGLAPLAVQSVFDAIERIKSLGTTVLLVEQNAHLALKVSDYAYVLERGSLRLQGPSAELADSEEVRKAYLGI